LDGFAIPAPAQVTQTVGTPSYKLEVKKIIGNGRKGKYHE
jgi:hypothetical protein